MHSVSTNPGSDATISCASHRSIGGSRVRNKVWLGLTGGSNTIGRTKPGGSSRRRKRRKGGIYTCLTKCGRQVLRSHPCHPEEIDEGVGGDLGGMVERGGGGVVGGVAAGHCERLRRC